MSISTFNFQFYNYKLNPASPGFGSAMALGTGSGPGSGSTSRTSTNSNSFISELEMDIDEDMSAPSVTSTPKPRFTSQLSLELTKNQNGEGIPALRPKLHTAQKRWSMELREKVLEMSKRNNASDVEQDKPQAAVQQEEVQQQQHQQLHHEQQHLQEETAAAAVAPTVSDKINFFNKLTNTFESSGNTNSNRNRFISLLRSSRPQVAATTGSNSSLSSLSSQATTTQMVPPPKPKRLGASAPIPSPFATPTGVGKGGSHRKCTLRRKPSMDKSRATISRQNSSATVRPQHHTIMEDLSLVVPVRMRIAEYEQRISMSA
ncbi:protein bottleneck [Drosophila kikkawai]|uniref:Protein bottleneck n=1 Tax=Drosophila kikkawai TaxID=30033 RepID=A0A6P4JHP1_DROKI